VINNEIKAVAFRAGGRGDSRAPVHATAPFKTQAKLTTPARCEPVNLASPSILSSIWCWRCKAPKERLSCVYTQPEQ
jgi:hypothetical protein